MTSLVVEEGKKEVLPRLPKAKRRREKRKKKGALTSPLAKKRGKGRLFTTCAGGKRVRAYGRKKEERVGGLRILTSHCPKGGVSCLISYPWKRKEK